MDDPFRPVRRPTLRLWGEAGPPNAYKLIALAKEGVARRAGEEDWPQEVVDLAVSQLDTLTETDATGAVRLLLEGFDLE